MKEVPSKFTPENAAPPSAEQQLQQLGVTDQMLT